MLESIFKLHTFMSATLLKRDPNTAVFWCFQGVSNWNIGQKWVIRLFRASKFVEKASKKFHDIF